MLRYLLLLKAQDTPHHKIAKVADVCENTVRNCLKAYQTGGIQALKVLNFYQPQSQLKCFEEQVREYFKKTPPGSISQACEEIKNMTGLSLQPTQMRNFVKKLGLQYRKVNSIPAKANLQKQKAFHDELLMPRLEEAKAGERTVYFVDAAHFVLGAFLGYLWCFCRVFVRTPSGRQRFNVLGALNAITKTVTLITNDSYITSLQVCELLKILAKDATKPITVVLDNARYQRCAMVMALAHSLGIELLFLPPYSPNLNLIERLWKLVKKECLYSRYYENFALFRNRIQSFLDTMHQTQQAKLDSLLTLNFQKFTQDQFQLAI